MILTMDQVEELKTLPAEPTESAPALVAKALDQELGAPGSASAAPAAPTQVNDLTSMVKKKKKPPVDAAAAPTDVNGTGKRKVEDEHTHSPTEKKAKLEETPAS